MNKGIFHTRVELFLGDGDHHPCFTFYNVKAEDKHQVDKIAREKAASDFGGDMKDWRIGHTWDEGVMVDHAKDPVINPNTTTI